MPDYRRRSTVVDHAMNASTISHDRILYCILIGDRVRRSDCLMKNPSRRQRQARGSLPSDHSYFKRTTFLTIQRRILRIIAVPANTASMGQTVLNGRYHCPRGSGPPRGTRVDPSCFPMTWADINPCTTPCSMLFLETVATSSLKPCQDLH